MNFNQTSHTNTHRHTDWMCWWIHQQVREIRHVCAYQQADALNSSKTEKKYNKSEWGVEMIWKFKKSLSPKNHLQTLL